MMPKNSMCHFPKLFPPLSHITPNLELWIEQDRNEPLWQHLQSWRSWMLTYMSLLPSQRNHGSEKISLGLYPCYLLVKLMQVKRKYSHYPLQCPNSYFLLQKSAGSSSIETYTSTKVLSSKGYPRVTKGLKNPRAFRSSQMTARSLQVHRWLRSVCLLSNAQVSEISLGPLSYDTECYRSPKTFLFVDRYRIFVVEGEDRN